MMERSNQLSQKSSSHFSGVILAVSHWLSGPVSVVFWAVVTLILAYDNTCIH